MLKAQRVLQFLLFLLSFPVAAFASAVSLQWDPSTDPDLAGYRVYYQANSSAQPFAGTGATEGSAPIDVASATSATVEGLDPRNSYYFAVTAYNTGGNESVYSNIVQVPEMVPPTVGFASPTAGGTVSGVAKVTVGAADNVGVTKVELYANDVLQGTLANAPYSFTWNTASLSSGQYTLTAKAYDAAGNVGKAQEVVSVSGDTTAPSVVISSPGNNAQVSGTVTVTASASDNVGVTSIALYDNAQLIYASNQGTMSYAWNATGAGSGEHTLVAVAYDGAGNAGSASVTVKVAGDSIPPVAAISAPASGATVSGRVSISASATDNVGVTKLALYDNGTLIYSGSASQTSYSWNSATVANGSHALTVEAFDAAGNVGKASVTVKVSNDTAAPAVAITAPGSGAALSGSVSVTASASDNVAVSYVQFFLNGALQAMVSSPPYSYSWNTAAVAAGGYILSAKAYDAAGNVGTSSSVAVTVKQSTADTTPPTVNVLSPTSAKLSGANLLISATASDNISVTGMDVYVDGALVTRSSLNSLKASVKIKPGTHTVIVNAYDAAKNKGSRSITLYR